MIQKIRSYLLDDKDNKESIGWYVVIVMLFPIIGIFFQYKKNFEIYLGSVNDKKIERSIFNIKLFEQKQMMENIGKMFGNEQKEYFSEILFQGKSIEDYVLSSEIKRIFLQSLFDKNIVNGNIASDFILFNINNKSYDKLRKFLGEVPFLLISGSLKPSMLGSLNIDMNKIDVYCEEVFQVNLLKNIFLVPLSIIERHCFVNYPANNLCKIHFQVFTLNFSDYLSDYLKGEKKKDEEKDIQKIDDNEMQFVYDSEVKKDLFLKNGEVNFKLTVFDIKKKSGSDLEDNNYLLYLLKEIELKKNDKKTSYDFFKNHLLILSSHNKITMNFDYKDLKNKISSTYVFPESLKINILMECMQNKNLKDFYVFVEKGKLYFIENVFLNKKENLSFDLAREEVRKIIIEKRLREELDKEILLIRYELESKKTIEKINWKKSEAVFSRDMMIEKNKKDLKNDNLNSLVIKKLNGGGLRVGNTFLEKENNNYIIYYVSNISYEDNNNNNNGILRKNKNYAVDVFIEALQKKVKMDINN